jgi:hypothetical protein
MTVAMVMDAQPVPDGHPKCAAKRRQGDGLCNLAAGYGTDHLGFGRCKWHGGSTPTQRKAVQAQVIEAKVRTMFGKVFNDKPVTNPLDVFAELAGTVQGWMQTMRALVEELNTVGYTALTGEQIRAEVQLFERSMDRANTVLSTYARLNIDERLARISATQSEMVMGAIEAALAAAGVSGARAIEAKRAAASRLRVDPATTT